MHLMLMLFVPKYTKHCTVLFLNTAREVRGHSLSYRWLDRRFGRIVQFLMKQHGRNEAFDDS